MTHRKLMSIIQVGYLGSSDADLRSASVKTTLGWGLWCIPKIKFVEEYRLNDKNYFQLQISILCHHVPWEPANMLSKYQSAGPFHGMKVLSGQHCFDWVQYQASFQMKFFMSSLTFNILSQKCSDQRKFGIKSRQYLYRKMSKNGGNRWFGCRWNRCFVMKGF